MSRIAQLLSLAKALPSSPIRTPGSPQLSDAIQKIVHRTFPSTPSAPSSSPQIESTPSLGPGEERAVERMIAPLERIESNAALKQYPLSNTTLSPPHDPLYYKRMVDGVHLSQKGQGRAWWRRFFQVRGEA